MNDAPRRVLIVTSAFPPTMLADMHRARILSYELPKAGWGVDILAPSVQFQRSVWVEPDSNSLMPNGVPVHEALPCCGRLFSWLGMHSVGWRAFWPMYRLGCQLLAKQRIDVIYITTAQFSLFCLGRLWARKFKIPYIVDYHDPWVRDQLNYTTTKHWLKLRIGATLSRWMEESVIRSAAGVVSVSPVYVDELRLRYGHAKCLTAERCEVIPFGGSDNDFQAVNPPPAPSNSAQREIVYVGAGGPIMARSFTAFCKSLSAVRQTDPALVATLKIRLFGTYSYWKEGDSKPLQDIASRFGLADVIEEIPPRISYIQAMERVQRSDGLLVLGVDDAGYIPSKLFTYALSSKPLLASFRTDSAARGYFTTMPGLGHLLEFKEETTSTEAVNTMRSFLDEVKRRKKFDRRQLIAQYLAPGMAQKHAALFNRIMTTAAL